jgi:acetylornithine deacetylase
MIENLTQEAIELLKKLISKQSFSGEENETALLIMQWFSHHNIQFESDKHNVWAKNKHFNLLKKTILLNSHHDTVKPNKGYMRNPFSPDVEDGKLYGYNMKSISTLKNKMKDDIDVIYYQLKKSAEKEQRRKREI